MLCTLSSEVSNSWLVSFNLIHLFYLVRASSWQLFVMDVLVQLGYNLYCHYQKHCTVSTSVGKLVCGAYIFNDWHWIATSATSFMYNSWITLLCLTFYHVCNRSAICKLIVCLSADMPVTRNLQVVDAVLCVWVTMCCFSFGTVVLCQVHVDDESWWFHLSVEYPNRNIVWYSVLPVYEVASWHPPPTSLHKYFNISHLTLYDLCSWCGIIK